MAQDLANWRAESCRLTFLFPTPELPPPGRLWKDMFGDEPEQIQENPRSRTCDERGQYHQISTRIVQTPGRIDVFFQAGAVGIGFVVGDALMPAAIGTLKDASELLRDISRRNTPSFANSTRIAAGVVLQKKVDSYLAANQVIRDLLPGLSIPDGSTDILWQVNHPVESVAIPEVTLNRLHKVQIMQIQQMLFAIGGPGPLPLAGQPQIAVQLELDFNTSPMRTEPLVNQQVVQLVDELLVKAAELASLGDAR
jgi:hypothetical protein